MMDRWDQNLPGPYRGNQRMQNEQNGLNIPYQVKPPYTHQQGAHLPYEEDAESDHMSLDPQPNLDDVASGQVLRELPSSSQSLDHGQQSASGASIPDFDAQETTQLERILKLRIGPTYDDKKKKCLKTFKGTRYTSGQRKEKAIQCLYFINDMVKCHMCKNCANQTDRFQHKETCVVLKAMKEVGYSSSSDDDSIPEASADSDESTNTASTRGEIPREPKLESSFATATGSQNPAGPQPVSNHDFFLTSNSEGRLPSDGKSVATISGLENIGYDIATIRGVFQVKGRECLESIDDFFRCEEDINRSSNTPGAQSFSYGSYAQSNSSGQGSNDVILPPTLQ